VTAVDAGGLEEIRITQLSEASYVLSVKIRTKREWTYLATRRTPLEPRKFKGLESAVGVGRRLFGTRRFNLILSPNCIPNL
jgi:hypothetical protein